MSDKWRVYRLSDILILIGGGTPKTNIPEYWDGTIPWLSVADFNNDYRYVSSTEKSITERGLAESSTKLLNMGDLIISARGTVGAIAQLGKNMAFNQTCYGITARPELTMNDFLYYLLRHAINDLRRITHGAVFDTITRSTFDNITVSIPPLPEQRAIARILGSLDDKIELNRRMNETLEAIAQAIFKSWFVDFDPMRAKAEGRQPEGMDAETAALFPDEFEVVDGREVPKGWKSGKLGEGFHITMGQSPPGATYNENGEGVPFFQGSTDFGFRYPSNRVFCTEPKRMARKGDTLVSVRAPVGDINMACEDCCIGRGVAAVRHVSGSRSYTYYFMQGFRERFFQYEAEGTVFGSINKGDFLSLPMLVPPADIVQKFEQTVSPLDELIEINTEQSRTLAEIRDTLLPKLISGEINFDYDKFGTK